MSSEEIQKSILEFLYEKWKQDPFHSHDIDVLVDQRMIKTTKDAFYANAEYLASKGLIEKRRTGGRFITKITVYGIDHVENKRVAPDIDIRMKILRILKEIFDKNPYEFVGRGKLIELSGFSELEIERNMVYLDEKGFARVKWAAYGFSAMITDIGIDALKEESVLEKETAFMSYAYSNLYTLENRLRIFIERKLRESHDEQWWEKGVPASIRKTAEERKKEEPNSALSLISYTEFEDLRKIIMNNWDIFKQFFKTQGGIVGRLDELEPIRHIIAHCRMLSNDDFAKLELFLKDISEMIKEK